MKLIFKNSSILSIKDGIITIKTPTSIDTYSNASVISVDNGTITLEVKHGFKKGDLVKIIGKETYYHIFNYMAGLYFYTFGGLNDNTLKLRMSNICDYNRDYTIISTSKEEQDHFDKICKAKGYIFNKENFSWESYKWKPKPGELMYFIGGNGKVLHYLYDDADSILKNYVAINNCFKTEEEAHVKLQKFLKVLQE